MVRLTADDYRQMLSALAPPGRALPGEADSNWQRLLAGLADEFGRAHERSLELLTEMLPDQATELLPEWERTAGLPDPCVTAEQSVDQRRRGLLRLLTGTGGQSATYFEALAASLGYDVVVSSYQPHTVGDDVAHAINGAEWRWAWEVRAPDQTVTYHTVDGTVRDPLADWGNEQLECVIRRYRPAESTVIFAYGDE